MCWGFLRFLEAAKEKEELIKKQKLRNSEKRTFTKTPSKMMVYLKCLSDCFLLGKKLFFKINFLLERILNAF